MNIFTLFLVFMVTWWMAFFMLLPRGVVSQHEVDEERVAGTDPGAPVSPDLWRKGLHAAIIAAIIATIYYFVDASGIVDFRSGARPWEK